MKAVRLAALAALVTQLSGCWFIFIPGSVTSAISDKLTGSEGSHCVGPNAKVGDIITIPGVGRGTVKSLSGTSMRCTQPQYPIRALLDFDNVQTPKPKRGCDLQKDENGENKLVCPD